jgi:hypothetical protein
MVIGSHCHVHITQQENREQDRDEHHSMPHQILPNLRSRGCGAHQ